MEQHFADEEIEDALCEDCGSLCKFRKCYPVYLPRTIVISFKRYKFNSFGRLEKDNTNIITDVPLKITTHDDDKSHTYEMTSAVLHHGNTPKSGHYTTLLKVGHSFISIDDDMVTVAQRHTLNSEGYMFIYRSSDTQLEDEIQVASICLGNTKTMDALSLHIENSAIVSPRKKMLVKRIQKMKLTDEYKPFDPELGFLVKGVLVKGIANPMPGQIVQQILSYLLQQFPVKFRSMYGIGAIRSHNCMKRKEISTVQFHESVASVEMIHGQHTNNDEFKCEICNMDAFQQEVTASVGSTLILTIKREDEWSFKELEINLAPLLNNVYSFEKLSYSLVSCYCPVDLSALVAIDSMFMHVTDSDLLEENGMEYVEDFCKGRVVVAFYELDSELSDLKITPVQGSSFANTFQLNEAETFRLELDGCETINALIFPGAINYLGYMLDEQEFSQYIKGWITDVHIDLYANVVLSKANNEDVTIFPAAFYGNNLCDDRTTDWNQRSFKDVLLFPANIDNQHWILLVVIYSQQTVLYMDPLGMYEWET